MDEERDTQWLRLVEQITGYATLGATAGRRNRIFTSPRSVKSLASGLKQRLHKAWKPPPRKNPRPAPTAFPEGSDGHCLMQALTARRIAFRCLRDEITNPKSRRPVMAFSIKGVTYYFDGCLRGGSSSLVPGSRSMARLPMTSSKIRV
jgi:hypothetical protein